MTAKYLAIGILCGLSVHASAQEIVKVAPDHARAVTKPEDLYTLPAGRWHFAKRLWEGAEPCTHDQCEAGFTDGILALSAEHSGDFVRIIAAFRGCEAVASSEVEVGKKPGKPSFGRVRSQMKRVVKGAAKTCKVAAPTYIGPDIAMLFPAKPRS
ncbi:MAG: hypothetical protein ACJ8EY_02955 [Sphingomicrobium sp.]